MRNSVPEVIPVALVTGGGKGIGLAIALELVSTGYIVISTSRDFLNSTIELRSTPSIIEVSFDINKPLDFEKLVANLKTTYGRLNLLVNNIGGSLKYGTWDQVQPIDWVQVYNLNVVSTVTAILACKTLLLETEGSSIINIGSSTASEPGEFNPHYAAAKAALSNLSKSLANYFGTKGVRVNEIRVGPVVTHSWDVLIEQTMDTVRKTKEVNFQEISLKIVKSIPIGRLGEPADVAKIVKFLASMDSSWITGSIIDLDGGKSRGY